MNKKRKPRRDKLHIMYEILEVAREGALKTQIMYRANLSFPQLNSYLKYMLNKHLLEKSNENGMEVYRPSEKGSNFLQRYREITELLKPEEELGCIAPYVNKRRESLNI